MVGADNNNLLQHRFNGGDLADYNVVRLLIKQQWLEESKLLAQGLDLCEMEGEEVGVCIEMVLNVEGVL